MYYYVLLVTLPVNRRALNFFDVTFREAERRSLSECHDNVTLFNPVLSPCNNLISEYNLRDDI